jgi:hypothetical protein
LAKNPSPQVGVREFIARDFDSLGDMLDLRRLVPLLGQGIDVAELLLPHYSRYETLAPCHKTYKEATQISAHDIP